MPLKRFWFYNKNINRIWAERDLRMLKLMAHSHSGESITSMSEELVSERGEIHIYQPVIRQLDLTDDSLDPEFDRAGLEALKASTRRKKKPQADKAE